MLKRSRVEKFKNIVAYRKTVIKFGFFISLVRGVENLVTNLNIDFFSTQLMKTHLFTIKKLYGKFKIDGVIGIELYDKEFLKKFLKTNIPIVVIDSAIGLRKYEI